MERRADLLCASAVGESLTDDIIGRNGNAFCGPNVDVGGRRKAVGKGSEWDITGYSGVTVGFETDEEGDCALALLLGEGWKGDKGGEEKGC